MSEYEYSSPYPPIRVNAPDVALANRLRADYAGTNSEFTAATQYSYQEILCHSRGEEDTAALLEQLAATEMHHMHLLGELIAALGGDPVFCTVNGRRGAYWSALYPSYVKNTFAMLSEDLCGEKAAIRAYEQCLRQTDDEGVQALLRRIITDEEHHVQLLTEAIRKKRTE